MSTSKIDDFLASQGVMIHQEGLEEVLEHFGVKGMHWGVRKSSDERLAKYDTKIAKAKAQVDHHETAIKNIKSHVKDANENGTGAELFQKKYGSLNNATLKAIHGKSATELLADHKEDLQDELHEATFSRNVNQNHLASLQNRRSKIAAKAA
jgi:chromosome segregation ATPase